jgi:hypothetical protein
MALESGTRLEPATGPERAMRLERERTALDAWIWTPGSGHLDLDAWIWTPGPGRRKETRDH